MGDGMERGGAPIPDELRAKIAGLKRQLREAQEERDRWLQKAAEFEEEVRRLKMCEGWAKAAHERAEAAGRDAKGQRALAEEVARLRDAVWAMRAWWRAAQDEMRTSNIEAILDRVHQCTFCRKSLGPQENKTSQGDGLWRCWPPCEPRAEALRASGQEESDAQPG